MLPSSLHTPSTPQQQVDILTNPHAPQIQPPLSRTHPNFASPSANDTSSQESHPPYFTPDATQANKMSGGTVTGATQQLTGLQITPTPDNAVQTNLQHSNQTHIGGPPLSNSTPQQLTPATNQAMHIQRSVPQISSIGSHQSLLASNSADALNYPHIQSIHREATPITPSNQLPNPLSIPQQARLNNFLNTPSTTNQPIISSTGPPVFLNATPVLSGPPLSSLPTSNTKYSTPHQNPNFQMGRQTTQQSNPMNVTNSGKTTPPMHHIQSQSLRPEPILQHNIPAFSLPQSSNPPSGTDQTLSSHLSSTHQPFHTRSQMIGVQSPSGTSASKQHQAASHLNSRLSNFPLTSQVNAVPLASKVNAGPPLSSQLNTGPPFQSQTNTGPPLSSQHITGPPFQSQTNTGPPLSSQLNTGPPFQSQTITGPPLSSQLNSGPPFPPQNSMGPPLSSQLKTGPPLQSQNNTGPPLSHLNTGPSFSSQNNMGPPLSSQLKTGPPFSSQNNTGPPLSSQLNTGPPFSSQNSTGPPLSSQLNTGLPFPPLSSQLNTGPSFPPQNSTGPPLTSQLNPGPPFSTQNSTGPPLSSQLNPGLSLSSQPSPLITQYQAGPLPNSQLTSGTALNFQHNTGSEIRSQQLSVPPMNSYPHGGAQFMPQPTAAFQNMQPGFGMQNVRDPKTGSPAFPSYTQAQPPTIPELEPIRLLENRNLLPKYGVEFTYPKITVGMKTMSNLNPLCICSTLNSIPESQSLLNKSKLPLGVLMQPFKELSSEELLVISTTCIIRCQGCRTYINPYVAFMPGRKWKCNICNRFNTLPEGFNPDDANSSNAAQRGSYAEILHPMVEYIANSDYALRPPQPPVYLFILDVSYNSLVSGSLSAFCEVMLECIDDIPGDSRTQVGLITFNSSIHYYCLRENQSAHILEVPDLEEVFIPTPTDILVYLKDSKAAFKQLISDLPKLWANVHNTDSCLGVAAEAGYKLISQHGGRMTVLVCERTSIGSGSMNSDQAMNYLKKRGLDQKIQIVPSTDFYKKLALECCEKQIAVDLFVTCGHFADLASISCLAKFSSGQVRYYPALSKDLSPSKVKGFQEDLRRYLTRDVGFEAVMRVRCTPGLALHTFHGSCFVRSTDLLALPNVNPDHSFAIQLSYDDNLDDVETAFLQSALLYTNTKGERRIRVATLALPVCKRLADVYAGANIKAIAAIIAKMAVDRCIETSIGNARSAILSVLTDLFKAFSPLSPERNPKSPQICLPRSICILPLYILGLLKHNLLKIDSSIMYDERSYQTVLFKTLPLDELMSHIYPDLHSLHDIVESSELINEADDDCIKSQLLQLSSEKLTIRGAYLMYSGAHLLLYLGKSVSHDFIENVFNVRSFDQLAGEALSNDLPMLDNTLSERVRLLVSQVKQGHSIAPIFTILSDDSYNKMDFVRKLVEDKCENTMSYHELLCYLREQLS